MSTRERDQRLHQIASNMHGVIDHDRLRSIGFDADAIAHGCDRGRLTRLHPGVYAVGHVDLSEDGRRLAAVLRAGPRSEISHVSAARAWGMSRFLEGSIHVTSPRRVRATFGMTFHSHDGGRPQPSIVRRVPTASRAQAVIDLGNMLTAPQLANVIYEGSFRQASLSRCVQRLLDDRPLFPGRATVVRAMALTAGGSSGTRSMLEDTVLAALQAARIRIGEINVVVGGSCDFEVDLLSRAARLVVEVDGVGHRRRRAGRTDAQRTEALIAAGYVVIRLREDAALHRLNECVERIRKGLDGRRRRSRTAYLAVV